MVITTKEQIKLTVIKNFWCKNGVKKRLLIALINQTRKL